MRLGETGGLAELVGGIPPLLSVGGVEAVAVVAKCAAFAVPLGDTTGISRAIDFVKPLLKELCFCSD